MAVTPLRKQYLRVKQKYPEAIVFFRLGDFYETFDEDAKVASQELDVVLTSREMGKGQRIPMAGIPHHALDNYLAKLINRGHKVAICEQLSPPGKGLVERDVIRVVTPGTVVEPNLLASKSNNYLACLVVEGEKAGIAYVDISTSEFATTQLPAERAMPELERLQPSEVLIPEGADDYAQLPFTISRLDDYWFDLEIARESLLEHFNVATVEGYGCAGLPLAIRAAGALVHYVKETQKETLPQLNKLATYSTDSFMTIDGQTIRNLELFQGGRWGETGHSLLSVIDLTKTAMGGRMLKNWLRHPLLDLATLNRRQETIAWFHQNSLAREKVISLLSDIADLERLVNRVSSGRVIPRELVTLRSSLEKVPDLKTEMADGDAINWLSAELKPCPDIVDLIARAIADEPGDLEQGGVIREGFSPELDEIRRNSRQAKQYLAALEQKERQRTGIKSLKVGYNRVFGYYIEVSRANLSLVPPDYIRKQTLAEAERFFTPELKEYESLILNAQEKIADLETAIFRQICQQISAIGRQILTTARAIAQIDSLSSLAEVAVRHSYVRPTLTNDDAIDIKGGRHPIVEQSIGSDNFIPNDAYLCNKDNQIIILTGPNMSGKSTYLRQVALIILLAQIGSFVPADSANIGIVDRIFTRIGAQEDLAAGQSTFMVEMTEAANILNNATPRSFIILDEIGRGTSTYDGLSIAWAVAECIHNHPELGTKTLFATHYHELVDLADTLPRVKNFNVAVAEEGDKVIFLHKIVHGGTDRSYGIHVAQLAGLPKSVIARAQEVLAELESRAFKKGKASHRKAQTLSGLQIPLFSQDSLLADEISRLDIDSMSPLEAITKLYEFKRMVQENKATSL
ncbi:MAG: DNA mismatch repair protein MutS [Chloroflexi bacterium]|nr:MAG: DNA mismatch repair protein MutS [Chloroflexota bacterium]